MTIVIILVIITIIIIIIPYYDTTTTTTNTTATTSNANNNDNHSDHAEINNKDQTSKYVNIFHSDGQIQRGNHTTMYRMRKYASKYRN